MSTGTRVPHECVGKSCDTEDAYKLFLIDEINVSSVEPTFADRMRPLNVDAHQC